MSGYATPSMSTVKASGHQPRRESVGGAVINQTKLKKYPEQMGEESTEEAHIRENDVHDSQAVVSSQTSFQLSCTYCKSKSTQIFSYILTKV